ncbi:GNAT family N-acetyltransferase [Paenibacillaceae bacterium]|nr:GNAT family N-acetyltransferase [Paenibacillaceae bacterium]
MELELRKATLSDIEILAEMNRQLIEDEGSMNPMTLDELKQRMYEWLETSYNADFLILNQETAGYALYHFKQNQYEQNIQGVYLRQYFIGRKFRKLGLGLKGIKLLKEHRFKDVNSIEIDVLESNTTGMNFWGRAGFKPYYTNMRMKI